MKNVEDDPELYQQAIAALVTYCEDYNLIFAMPSSDLSEIGRKYVYLKNVNGLLAKYDIQNRTIVD